MLDLTWSWPSPETIKILRRWNLIASQEAWLLAIFSQWAHVSIFFVCPQNFHVLFFFFLFVFFNALFAIWAFCTCLRITSFPTCAELVKVLPFSSNWNTRKSNPIRGGTYPKDCFIADVVSSCLVAGGRSHVPWQSVILSHRPVEISRINLHEISLAHWPDYAHV